MQFDASIFKAYDIRGIYPDQLNAEIMEKIGQAFVVFLNKKKILVGSDMRISSPTLVEAFIRGARKQGADVVSLGLISTDCLYFAAGKYGLPGAIITASHNPKDYNGVKFCRPGAEPIGLETGLAEIKELVLLDELEPAKEKGGLAQNERILDEFREHCYKFIDKNKIKPLKIVVDAGNGMAGRIIPAVFRDLPCEIVPMYFELDGNFPNHQPSPIEKENNRDLMAEVKSEKADLGLAFDGDADRVFFVDNNGEMIDSSFIAAMIAQKLLEKKSKAKIIYTVTVSHAVPEIIAKYGGEAIMTRVGHSFIKQVMKETGAVFASEHSGHYYFIDNYRADSGVIAALIVIEILSDSGKTSSKLIEEFALYERIEETNFKVEDKAAVMAKLREKYGAKIIQEFDGISFDLGDWWFNVRGSNTEPLLRLNLEAKNKKLLAEKTAEISKIVTQ